MRTNSLALTGFVATIVATSFGCNISELIHQAKASKTTSFEVPIPEAGKCKIQTENGRVECIAGDVNEIQVEAEITAQAKTIELAEAYLDQITIDRVEIDGVAEITANIPRGVSGSVSLTVTLPADTELEVKTSNGRIEVVGVASGTMARTSNGAIRLQECTGLIEAKSSNGRIEIDGDSLKEVNAVTSNGSVRIEGQLEKGNHRVKTSNGRISVDLSGAPVRFMAKTTNGKIRVNGRKVKSGQTITLGGGTETDDDSDDSIARLALETSNGSISVESGDSRAERSDDEGEDGDDDQEDESDEDDDDEDEGDDKEDGDGEDDEDGKDDDDRTELPIGEAILKGLGL